MLVRVCRWWQCGRQQAATHAVLGYAKGTSSREVIDDVNISWDSLTFHTYLSKSSIGHNFVRSFVSQLIPRF